MTIFCYGLRIKFDKVTVLTIMEHKDRNNTNILSVIVILTSPNV